MNLLLIFDIDATDIYSTESVPKIIVTVPKISTWWLERTAFRDEVEITMSLQKTSMNYWLLLLELYS